MNTSSIRPLAAASVLLFLLGVVGLVTVDEDAGGTVLTTAVAATTAEGSARMTLEIALEVGGKRTTVSADGMLDFSGERAQMTMRSPVLPAPMEIVTDGTTVYVRANVPQIQAEAGGKPWVAYDGSAYAQRFGDNPFGGTDPLAMLRLLEQRGVASAIRTTGTEPVRGTPTTRYTADLDVPALLRTFESPQFKAVADALDDAEATMDVWVGAEGVVRRSSMALRFDLGGATYATTATMELFDFGIPVDIAVPPADQVQHVDGLPGRDQ